MKGIFDYPDKVATEINDTAWESFAWIVDKIEFYFWHNWIIGTLAVIGVIAIIIGFILIYRFILKLIRDNKALNLRLKRIEKEIMYGEERVSRK